MIEDKQGTQANIPVHTRAGDITADWYRLMNTQWCRVFTEEVTRAARRVRAVLDGAVRISAGVGFEVWFWLHYKLRTRASWKLFSTLIYGACYSP